MWNYFDLDWYMPGTRNSTKCVNINIQWLFIFQYGIQIIRTFWIRCFMKIEVKLFKIFLVHYKPHIFCFTDKKLEMRKAGWYKVTACERSWIWMQSKIYSFYVVLVLTWYVSDILQHDRSPYAKIMQTWLVYHFCKTPQCLTCLSLTQYLLTQHENAIYKLNELQPTHTDKIYMPIWI